MDRINNFNRRDWLKLLTAGAAAACATHSAQAQAAQPLKTAARIVIASGSTPTVLPQLAGIEGVITGRAIYEGTIDFEAAQNLADELSE